MNKLLVLLILSIITFMVQAQQAPDFYNIKGEPIHVSEGCHAVVIYYNAGFCHQCMVDLSKASDKWANAKSNREVYVMIGGGDISEMRMQEACVRAFFDSSKCLKIVFDLDPIYENRYSQRYHISRYPAMIYVAPNGSCKYLSYDELFVGRARLKSLPL